jgi:uncharacterized protein (DUF433 family)
MLYYPSLNLLDLEAAWDYYKHHKNEINQAIAMQDDEDYASSIR